MDGDAYTYADANTDTYAHPRHSASAGRWRFGAASAGGYRS
jgi:hypothetical protein